MIKLIEHIVTGDEMQKIIELKLDIRGLVIYEFVPERQAVNMEYFLYVLKRFRRKNSVKTAEITEDHLINFVRQ